MGTLVRLREAEIESSSIPCHLSEDEVSYPKDLSATLATGTIGVEYAK